jgi:hypothetical protein
MAQITLYLDESTERLVKASAEAAGLSQSRWVAEVIQRAAAPRWPDAIRSALGSWSDFPEAESLREQAADLPREPL